VFYKTLQKNLNAPLRLKAAALNIGIKKAMKRARGYSCGRALPSILVGDGGETQHTQRIKG
jgi:hypothetical protein